MYDTAVKFCVYFFSTYFQLQTIYKFQSDNYHTLCTNTNQTTATTIMIIMKIQNKNIILPITVGKKQLHSTGTVKR